MTKRCNSEYPYATVRLCKFGHLKKGIFYCRCGKKCATCTVGNGMIKMHPDLYEIYIKQKSVKKND